MSRMFVGNNDHTVALSKAAIRSAKRIEQETEHDLAFIGWPVGAAGLNCNHIQKQPIANTATDAEDRLHDH